MLGIFFSLKFKNIKIKINKRFLSGTSKTVRFNISNINIILRFIKTLYIKNLIFNSIKNFISSALELCKKIKASFSTIFSGARKNTRSNNSS